MGHIEALASDSSPAPRGDDAPVVADPIRRIMIFFLSSLSRFLRIYN
jgi:hypothetical protein